MKKKEIKVFGETLTIAFNLSVQIMWEEITDKSFDLTTATKGKGKLALMMAAIMANNPDTAIDTDKLLTIEAEELAALDQAIAECMTDFYHIPAAMKHEPAQTDDNAPASSPS